MCGRIGIPCYWHVSRRGAGNQESGGEEKAEKEEEVEQKQEEQQQLNVSFLDVRSPGQEDASMYTDR